MTAAPIASSFRDPSGFLFRRDGVLYRRVNPFYQESYDLLMSSGLYADLVEAGLLIPHEEVAVEGELTAGAYKILKPQVAPFISYPYEWCFSQLKDAAKTTLEIQKRALAHGMCLKDASAYNIQFVRGKPVFIDTLSFEKYEEGSPWVAYRQFCWHFLDPLALMSLTDVRLSQLLRIYIDGIPCDVASPLLPWRTRLALLSLNLHIHLHAKSQKKYEDTVISKSSGSQRMSRLRMLGLIDSLESTVGKLSWKPKGTEWVDYYQDDSYTADSLADKERLVGEYIDAAKPKTVWDFGGNTGAYSRIAAARGADTICFDIDPACVELNYREMVRNSETNLLPLLLDLTNPSPRLGWANEERMSVEDRGPADMIMALALVHHLAISNNVPLPRIAEFMGRSCKWLLTEFIPKSDHKVEKLLATREDVFPTYTEPAFEQAFSEVFEIRKADRIPGSDRKLYLMEKRPE